MIFSCHRMLTESSSGLVHQTSCKIIRCEIHLSFFLQRQTFPCFAISKLEQPVPPDCLVLTHVSELFLRFAATLTAAAFFQYFFFQMDPKEDILTPLMRVQDPGYRQFVTNCFLLLDPKEIKACRAVMDDLWCSKSGREKLSQKLAHR